MIKKTLIESILIDSSTLDSEIKLYNFHIDSESAEFYSKQFSNVSGYIKEEKPDFSLVPNEMKEVIDFLKLNLPKEAIVLELGGSKYQHRSGYPGYFFENYIPLDISFTSIKNYVIKYNNYGIVADASKLPLKDKSVDAIFTHTFLEHPLDPNSVLVEIHRVLKDGGCVIHTDAWNCRWWQRYGIVGIKNYSDLTLKEKLIYLAAIFTEFRLIRYPVVILNRLFSLTFLSNSHNIKLKYKKLKPNYTLNLFCDEDAASSIDPVDVMFFYQSRGYKTIPKLNFIQKLFFNNYSIFFQKNC